MFKHIKTKVQTQFAAMVAAGPLFYIETDRDAIWEAYLAAIPEEHKQANRCSCCRSFIRQFGAIVGISNNHITTLWDFELEDPEYGAVSTAMRRFVASGKIAGPFMHPQAKCGTDKTPDPKLHVFWEHFAITLPPANVVARDAIGPRFAAALADHDVLLRSINEIKPDAVETVLDLIAQETLYRGSQHKEAVKLFQSVQTAGLLVPPGLRSNFVWDQVKAYPAVTRIRNTSIGTLLVDLSEGKELDHAVRAFEAVMAPANYKRPTAPVTPRMIETARQRIAELGLTGSLNRRVLTDRDLTITHALHVYRPRQKDDIFDQLKAQTPVNPRTLSGVTEIGIDEFLEKVLPTATAVRALVENSHTSNLMTLVGPADPDAPSLFPWDNGFSWSYTGGVADSIKQRVKAAGGNVTGLLRVSLAWESDCDLDLHIVEPGGYEIAFQNRGRKSPTGGLQDVDANVGGRTMEHPVENITWALPPTKDGRYHVFVHNYSNRHPANRDGFTVEIEYQGEVFTFAVASNGPTNRRHDVVDFSFGAQGFQIHGDAKPGGYLSKEVWGVKTGIFTPIRAITLSPNHWDKPTGNKHVFFLLEGCKSDEPVRGFYNEHLKSELNADRKVLELLGSRIQVEKAEGELSGLGFSEDMRNHLIVQVDGSHTRTLKIKF